MAAEEALEGIAIIGISGRFPQAPDLQSFWEMVREGREAVRFFNPKDLVRQGIPEVIAEHPSFVPAGLLLDDLSGFDPGFFSMTPGEARLLDPQHRLFLECCWEALECAGYNPETFEGSIGVYGGCATNRYYVNNLLPNEAMMRLHGNFQALMGNDRDFLTTRVSYKLNLKGPSVDIQTACSTSLVAAAMAYQSLMNYQADMFLVGAAALDIPHVAGYLWQDGDILAKDGHCYAFDARAKGTLMGNGAAVLLLKRLEDALADGDSIFAVLRGIAVNNDGANKVGFTAPSEEGQAKVIAEALELAEVEADTIGYVEAHGTGTELGDPIEVAALTRVFRESSDRRQFCAISSVKSNVGHMDTAAGAAGLVKAALALKEGIIPPSPNFATANPKIDFEAGPFYVPRSSQPWARGETPRRAAVSSFGIGGTNAHAILEEAPEPVNCPSRRSSHLLLLSARCETALTEARENLARHLLSGVQQELADVAYTLQVGRKPFKYRFAVTAANREESVSRLRQPQGVLCSSGKTLTRGAKAVFMFPGQGAQYPGMAKRVYGEEEVFRRHMDHCAEILTPLLDGLDIRESIFAAPSDAKAGTRLEQTSLTQPALFAMEFALAKLWQAFGIEPQAMIGHSVGEYVAATLAGVFSLEDALCLVATRGRLIQALPAGVMLAVPFGEEEAQPYLSDEISLATLNAPSRSVLAGPSTAIEALRKKLAGNGVATTVLRTSHAFHSTMMEGAVAPFKEALGKVRWASPQLPFVSNLTGTWVRDDQVKDPNYWLDHMCRPVRFCQGIRTLSEEKVFLEIGPGATLCGFARQSHGGEAVYIPSLPKPNQKYHDASFFQAALAKAWCAGLRVCWEQGYGHEQRLRVPLPTYPFQRRPCWVEPPHKEIVFHQAMTIAQSYKKRAPKEARQSLIHNELLTKVAEILEEDPADVEAGLTFLELDASSFFLTQVCAWIHQRFDVSIAAQELMSEQNTLNKLASWIDQKLPVGVNPFK